jgi:hypothetical protein
LFPNQSDKTSFHHVTVLWRKSSPLTAYLSTAVR